jgi:hypothetical protein
MPTLQPHRLVLEPKKPRAFYALNNPVLNRYQLMD